MHYILQIVTKGKPTLEEIEEIMKPYYEPDFFNQYYDPVTNEYRDIPENEHLSFLWNYYSVWEQDPIAHVKIGECFAMIDRQKRAHVRRWWNGHDSIDKNKEFEYWIKRINREKGSNDWVTTVDYHN